MSDKREGYIEDFISGIQVKETPEEIEAVQPFSKILVDDYGYPKENIVTRPQWRVKVRPSDRKKEYPVDIAVFSDSRKDDSSASIIVECKKKTRKDGRSQLEDYLRFSKARFGVWFNGEERLFLLKTEEDGQVKFSEIPNIPRYGKRQYNDVIEVSDSIQFDAKSLTYVVGELQLYSLQESSRDAVGEAFEIFIGPSLKGGQGQFFTPRNVVNMVIEMLDPSRDDKILDPACGSGGFLVESLRYVWNKVETEGRELGWPVHEIEAEKQKVAIRNFRGIDKDYFLSKVAKAYLAILGDGRGGVHSENSLERWKNWGSSTKEDIRMGEFDMVITNPPFGKKLAIMSTDILEQFDLGYKWKQNDDGVFEKMTLQDKQPPQILFIERCFDFLKPGGKLGIVLLESIFGMPKYQYVVDYITSKAKILGVVAMPEDLFQPHTHAKCCVVICEKLSENEVGKIIEPYDIFMSDVKWCGHDSRGNPTYTFDEEGKRVLLDDIPKIAAQYWEMGDKR